MTYPKKHLSGGKHQNKRPAWTDTLCDDRVEPVVDELFLLGQLPIEVDSLIREHCYEFLYWMIADVDHLVGVRNIREYYDACKERYRDLSEIVKLLLTAAPGQVRVSRIDRHGQLRYYILQGVNRKVSLTVNGNECYHLTRRPKVYGCLLRALCEGCAYLQQVYDAGLMEDPEYTRCLRAITLAVTTLGKAYEDIRGGRAFQNDEYARATERMHVVATPLDKESQWMTVFEEVRTDILLPTPPRYVADLSRIREESLSPFCYDDYHLSFKQTGSSYDGKPVPGLYAALFEVDHSNSNDELIGYVSHYNKVEDPRAVTYPRKSTMIRQHKLDYRLIHLAENAIQDRASYYHNRLARSLRRLKTDCTFHQDWGISQALKWTSPRWISRTKRNVYCLDISKATDTLNLEFQRMCLSLIWPEEHVSNWSNIMTGWAVLVDHHKIWTRFLQEVGQPQGLKSSFPAFALVHHIVMRMVMKANHLEDMDPQQFYRVLGDDSIINAYDPDLRILEDYKSCCSFIGWQTNDKGYLYRYGIDAGAFAEFAKIRVLNGVPTTPIPIRLLTNSVLSEANELALLTWYSQYVTKLTVSQVLELLIDHWQLSEQKAIGIAFLQTLEKTPFSVFSSDDDTPPDEGVLQIVYLAYTISQLRNTLIDQFLPDQLRDLSRSEKEKVIDPFLRSKEEKKFLNLAVDSDNKYIQMLQHNEDLINALQELYGDISVAAGALHLTEQEQQVLYQFCQLVMDLEYTGPLPISVWRPICDQSLDILARYEPRSRITWSNQSSDVLSNFESELDLLISVFLPNTVSETA